MFITECGPQVDYVFNCHMKIIQHHDDNIMKKLCFDKTLIQIVVFNAEITSTGKGGSSGNHVEL